MHMEKRKLGKNRGIWYGIVVSELEFSHEIKDRKTNEIVEKFYTFDVEVETVDWKGNLINKSVLPITLSETKLSEIKPEVQDVTKKLEIGNLVFLRGSWRAYDYRNPKTRKTQLEQNAYVKVIEVHDDYQVKTRNKFEFQGVLVKKLYEFERDENGVPLKDEKGKLISKKDEDGNVKYVVRKNKEGKVVNDFIVAINRPNGSDYIPCIAYKKLANEIAKEIEVGSEIEGSGYIRARYYQSGGAERVAYEAVITNLTPVKNEEEENIVETGNEKEA